MKICPVGAQLFHTDRQTDNDKANSRFFAISRTCLIKKTSVYVSRDLLVHSTECKSVCDTYIAQHFISIYSAMQHTNSIHPPINAHHICISQCQLNFISLYTENCKTTITDRGPDGGEEGNSFSPFTVNANMLVTTSILLYPPSKCPTKLQNFWVMIP